MKNYFVIGNPIDHSLSPRLHNFWIKKNNINAVYKKKKLSDDDLENLILKIKQKEIDGINVTVPFKKKVISYLENLTDEAKLTESVNTIFLDNDKITGHNTDIYGFISAFKSVKYDISGKKILILGAGGVVSSIIFALKKLKAKKIIISNRTRNKADSLKNLFKDLTVINWGDISEFDPSIHFETYENSTKAILEYYKKHNLIKEVNGEQKIEEINKEIGDIIDLI